MNIIDMPIASAGSTHEVAGSEYGWLQQGNDVRFTGFDDAIDFCRNRYAASKEQTVKNREIEILPCADPQTRDDLSKLTAMVDGQEMGFTRWSFGQLAALAKAPPAYLRTLAGPIVADALGYGLRFNREIESVKTYGDPVTGLRAITGPGYGRVPDHEVAEALDMVRVEGWEPADEHMGFSLSDRALSMFLIDKQNPVVIGRTRDGDDDVVYRGLRVKNSEVGNSPIHVSGFLFRGYCLNGMIFKMSGDFTTSIRHTSGAPERWAREVQPAIEHYAREPESKLVETVAAAKAARVAKDNDEMVDWLNERGLSRGRARLVIERVQVEEDHNPRTVWDAVQGITALARSERTVDGRSEMEEVGGQLLMKVAA